MAGDTLSTNRFGVELGGVPVKSVKKISGMVVEQEVVETNQMTPTGQPMNSKQPGMTKGGQVTLTKGLDQDDALTKWIDQTYGKGDVEGARKNLTIEYKKPNGDTIRRVDLVNSWVSKWNPPDLDAGQSASAEETVTIEFERIEPK